ncbi:MAG: polymer-forming cytoskeletal protein [Gammaproteobacteria bacterium]|nr:polymer-forming cytoskeletal protein [Gammaproteobacteria bacterium]MBU1554511.1 polymer-forming cytoskeletal protein [Gammaproteobacteria bacterium]MBU2071970.1 polymer-forming cytoskeletal protein [Gammaproteobacteria bacterium]MBU2181831.1 polymer-forming cytoskeletal protein [Gammaproteobacteria bacterium]MBU2204332.1 polymer-forming cytoskeletal protein [Gammaproteobacteria bacterium]
MGLFGKHAGNEGKHSVTTVIAQGCTVNGHVRLSGDIQVDGYVEGKIACDRTLVISASGRIKGEVTADKIIINGLYDGECYANSVEILPQGKAHGTIHCDDLSIERGGSFLGKTLPTSNEDVVSLPKNEQKKNAQLPDNAADKG